MNAQTISRMVQNYRVYINIGGQRFLTNWDTLQQPNCSRLSQLCISDPTYDSDNNEFYFDRSGSLFEYIIDLHRTGALHLPHNVCIPRMLDEMKFWDVPVENVASCCWTRIREHQNNAYRMEELRNMYGNETVIDFKKSQLTNKSHTNSSVSEPRKPGKELSCFRKATNYLLIVIDRPRSSYIALVSNAFVHFYPAFCHV